MIILKTIGAAVMIAGAVGLGAVGVGSGVASAAPGVPGTPWQQDDGGWGWGGHGGHGHWGHGGPGWGGGDWGGGDWGGDWGGPGWGWGAPCVSAPFVQVCA
jgi:hypothetical protein